MTGKTPWDDAQARAVIAAKSAEPGAALPILHDLQERFGYIDDAAIPADRRGAQRLQGRNPSASSASTTIFAARRSTARCSSSAAPNPARRSAARIWSRISAEPTASRSTASTPTRRSASRRSIASAIARFRPPALLDGEPIGRLDRDAIDEIVARTAKRRPHDRARLRSRRFLRRLPSAPTGRRAPSPTRRGARGVEIEIVRTGSRGLFWLEPMIEVETDAGRFAYGPIARRRRAARCSRPASWRAARTPRRSGSSTKSPI